MQEFCYSAAMIAKAAGGKMISATDSDAVCRSISTDSRKAAEGCLFVPIPGERVDGHDFLGAAFENGCRVSFTMREDGLPEGMTYILVDDSTRALQALAADYRRKLTVPVIGITGSVGKTTTKEMVATALSAGKKTFKTEGNMNSQVGLPQMILKLNDSIEAAVIEMGMSLVGEMDRLVNTAIPDCAVITNIGVSHIGQIGSREGIRHEKLTIASKLKKGAKLFINGDDPMFANLDEAAKEDEMIAKILENVELVRFGEAEICEFRAADVVSDLSGSSFTLQYEGKELPMKLQAPGIHNVRNACASMAVAISFGVDANEAAKALYSYQPVAMRGTVEECGSIWLLDDTYNASPDSMISSAQVLSAIGAKRHIAVLADMKELGEFSKSIHYDTGKKLGSHSIDAAFVIGPEAVELARGLGDAGITSVSHFDDNESAASALLDYMRDGDAVMIKGSRSMKLEEISRAVRDRFDREV